MILRNKTLLFLTVLYCVVIPKNILCQNEEPDDDDDIEEVLKSIRDEYQTQNDRNAKLLFPQIPGGHLPQRPGLYEKFDSDPAINETYDFIVIGSGAAGSVIANRLSEVPEWKILLLEVGDEATFLTDIPALAPVFQFTDLNWGYKMEKQDNVALGLIDERMPWPRGRALGGTSIINYMIAVRGNKLDYKRWAAMGNPGWSYKDVYKYFIKSEDAHIERADANYHFQGGYLGVQDIPYRTESAHAFVRACQEAGHKYVDYNGKQQLGVSYVQGTLRDGLRCSVEKGFLRPVRNRDNLTILPRSRAVKILIDPKTKEAIGVQYVRNKKYHTALASKEVISSAGAFNSPQLLMLSGIGPKKDLEELNITVLQNLPVGQKMYDHISFIGLVFTVNASIVIQQSDWLNPKSFVDVLIHGRGPLTMLGGVEALTYIKTNISKDPEPYPDMEIIFASLGMHTDKGTILAKTFAVKQEIYDTVWKPLEGRYAWQPLPMLVHPKSYGYLKLKSKNPYHWPKFYGNYFTDPENEDIKTFIATIRELQRIAKAPSLQAYDCQQVKTKIPGCQQHKWDSDEYWECALRHITPTLHHQVSTCKMGPSNDPEAVVDNKLRVYGIKRLRVADTSIIPLPLTAHTNVPAIMVGEKASDMIKEDWLNVGTAKNIDIRFLEP